MQVVSFLKARKIAQEELNAQVAEQARILEIDTEALTNLETKVASGISFEKAFSTEMNGASEAAIKHAKEMNGVAGMTDKFVVKQQQAQTALKATTIASKAATVAMKALSVAANVGIMLVANFLISGVTKLVDSWNLTTEEARENLETISSEIEETNSKLKDQQDIVKNSAKRFAELSQGVDRFGRNRNLNNDDYEEFLDLSNQLADIFPTLSRNYDENGNKIVQLSGNVNTIVGSLQNLVEVQRELANQEIFGKTDEIFSSAKKSSKEYYKEISDIENLISEYEDSREKMSSHLSTILSNDLLKSDGTFSISYDNYELIDELRALFDNLGVEYIGENLRGKNSEFLYQYKFDPNKLIDLDVEGIVENYNDQLDQLHSKLVTAKNNKENQWASWEQSLSIWLMDDSSVETMSDDAQAMLQTVVNSLDWNELDFDDEDEAYNYIRKALLEPLKDNEEVKEAFNNMLEVDPDSVEFAGLAEAFQTALNNATKNITINGKPIVIDVLDFAEGSISDRDRMQSVINQFEPDAKVQEQAYKYISKLSAEQRQIFYESSVGLHSFNAAVREFEKASSSASDAMARERIFTDKQSEAVEKYKSTLSSVEDAYEKLSDISYGSEKLSLDDLMLEFQDYDWGKVLAGIETETEALENIGKKALETLLAEIDSDDPKVQQLIKDWKSTLSNIFDIDDELEAEEGTYEHLKSLLEDINNKYVFNASELSKLIRLYPELASAIKLAENGYYLEEDAVISLLNTSIDASNKTIAKKIEETEAYIALHKARMMMAITMPGEKDEAIESHMASIAKAEEELLHYKERLKEINETKNKYGSGTSDSTTEIDWLTQSLSNLQEVVDDAQTSLDNIDILGNFDNIEDQIKAIDALSEATSNLYDGYVMASDEYERRFNNADIDDDIRSKIISKQEINLEEFSSEEAEKINDAIDAYQSYLDAENKKNELKVQLDVEIPRDRQQRLWGYFDEIQNRIQRVADEADFLIELLSFDDLIGEKGDFTSSGLATLGQQLVGYNTQLEKAREYAEELVDIQSKLAEDPSSQFLIDQAREYEDAQRDAIKSALQYKQAVIDLAKEGIEKQIEATKELIEERKNAMDAEMDLYKRQEDIAEKTKNINTIQKQLTVAKLDNSESGMQRVQELQNQLKDAQKDLEDTQYENWKNDQQQMLDELQDEYGTLMNEVMNNEDKLFSDMQALVDDNTDIIKDTIEGQASEYGIKLSGSMESIIGNINNNAYGLPAIKGVLDKIAAKEYSVSINGGDSGQKDDTTTTSGGGNDKQPINTNSTKTKESTGDNNINLYDKVRFEEGVYHGSSDGSGGTGRKNLGKDVYVTKINSNSKYPFHISEDKDGKKRLGWVNLDQLSGYATGLRKAHKDELAWTQENGNLEYIIRKSDGALLTPVNHGDMVLKPEMSKRLWEMTNDPTSFIMGNIKSGAMVNVPRTSGVGDTQLIIENIIMNGVNDPVKFKGQLIDTLKSADVQKAVRSVSTDLVMGKSTFGINKY